MEQSGIIPDWVILVIFVSSIFFVLFVLFLNTRDDNKAEKAFIQHKKELEEAVSAWEKLAPEDVEWLSEHNFDVKKAIEQGKIEIRKQPVWEWK